MSIIKLFYRNPSAPQKASSETGIDFCTGSLLKKILIFSFPLIITNVLQLLFNATAMIIVGQFNGDQALAAVGSTSSLVSLLVSIFNGISVGAGVIAANYFGARNKDAVSKTVHTSIIMSVFLGILLLFTGQFFSRQILILMNSPANVIDLSTLYLRCYFYCMPAFMVYNFGSALIRASGDSRHPLYYLTFCGLVNVLLSFLFVGAFRLSVAGAGLATVISQYISAFLIINRLRNDQSCFQLTWKKLHFSSRYGYEIFKVGVPIGLRSVAMPVSNVLIQSSINSFGAVVIAGNSAAVSLENMIYAILESIQQTLITVTSQNYGAGKYGRIIHAFHICMVYVSIAALFLGITVNIYSIPLLHFYTSGEEALAVGILRLRLVNLPYILCGLMEVSGAVLSGTGHSLPPMIISVIGVSGLRILWVLTFFQIHPSLESLYLSYPISWGVTFIGQYICFRILWKKIVKKTQINA
ncbi:MAG: MATE family efflux transporter [Eubacteriales bacterium]|nr:MATE family efflux transporter [Eubacteriales bacterium]